MSANPLQPAAVTTPSSAFASAAPARDGHRWRMLSPALVILIGGMVLPMLIMAVVSVSVSGDYGGVVWGKFSPHGYIKFLYERDFDDQMVFNADYLRIFQRSILLSLFTTAGCLLIGFPTALYIALQPEKRRNTLLMLVSVPFWTNQLVRVYAWMLLLRDGGLIDSARGLFGFHGSLGILYSDTAVAIGLLYSFVPFMVLPIYTTLEKMDWKLVEAAFDLGANRWLALRRVVVPLAMPGIVSGCVLVFVPALGAYIVPDLLGGGKSLMIGNLIQLQFGSQHDWPFGAALSFTLLTLVLLALFYNSMRARRAVRGGRV